MTIKNSLNFKIGLKSLLIMLLAMGWFSAYSQDNVVSGLVKDDNGEPLPGVSVQIKGTTKGGITDLDGKYSVNASEGETLVFSFVGFTTKETLVGSETVIDLILSEDVAQLETIVVTGYGSQKKSVVTGAISSVKASDLQTLPVNNISQSLQGRVSGVTIAAESGQPGSASTIRIRGITTLNNNDPLWIIDGIVVDNGGINYLNQSDIASIEVLKDASSQAIYGARAAAGVILVTTKAGESGKAKLTYNGYVGVSGVARKLDLLNATEYATIINEATVAGGRAVKYSDPSIFGEGTDWQAEIFNNSAFRQNHEVSLSGGNDVSTYYLSFGHLDQEGIVTTDISKWQRTSFRLNTTHQVKKWLKIGENIGYARLNSSGIGNTNDEFGGPLISAINLDPITPVVITDPDLLTSSPYSNQDVIRDDMGRPYSISREGVGQNITNPLAYIKTRLGNYGYSDEIVGNAFAEITPIEGLKLRSTIGTKIAFWGGKNFTPTFYLNAATKNETNSIAGDLHRRFDWNLENTISYTRTINDHHFTALIGQGAYRDGQVFDFNVTKSDIPVDNFDDASLSFDVPSDNISGSTGEGNIHTVSSLFARLNYDFKEKYLLTGVIRRDGSSRFGTNNKYGIFPSVSAGWVISRENFWPENRIVNFLKFRGGYGVVGNDNIEDFRYLSTIGLGRNYTIGRNTVLNGFSPNAPSNPDLKWEETNQANIALEATLLDDFTLNIDWYKKVTVGILRDKPIPSYSGVIANPSFNIGDMQNDGVEIELTYNKKIGDLQFTLGGNVSYVDNKVTNLGDVEFYNTSTYQTQGTIARMAVGQPINSFYGYKADGIFQTQAEVESYTGENGLILPKAKPGDFKWVDLNGDGKIDDEDRTFLGSPIPNWTYGINIKAEYKNFDLLAFGQGAAGNQIYQGLRRFDTGPTNYQRKVLGRWTGPGTSNEHPRLTLTDGDDNGNYTRSSDFYIEDGDYFRLKVLQIGYTIPQSIIGKAGMSNLRIYVMAENLFTLTKYTGYDPEIGGGSFGIDRGIYPQARSYLVGLSVAF